MAEYSLTPELPLGGYSERFGAVTLREVADLAIVSVAFPLGGEARAERALEAGFGVAPPPVGASRLSPDGARLARLARDLLFVLFERSAPDAEAVVAARTSGAAYTTDQTDVWVALEIAGPGTGAALERICLLDLHPDSFSEGSVARTSMEHLGTIILRTGPDAFVLLSARSSAPSFLQAVTISLRNTA